jgi:CheY-like chemotaxis protein
MVEIRVPLIESTLRFARHDSNLHVAEPASMRSTVLVVDDDAAVRESLSMAMVASGYRVLTAASGAEALNRAIEAMPGLDAVIADLGLGRGPDGIQVVRALRERLGRPVPALLLTGDTTPERLRDIAESGLEVIHKPVLPDVLGAMVGRLVES